MRIGAVVVPERRKVMQGMVRDVMTADVLTVAYDAVAAEVVATMTAYDVSAVAVVGEFERVLGIITRTDVLNAMRLRAPDPRPRLPWRRPVVTPDWAVTSAGQMMSAPALTVDADATLAQAGRLMRRHTVNRLLVTGADRRLLGVVTAADLLKVYDRTDEELRAGVRQAVAGLPVRDLALGVHDGVATVAATVTDAGLAGLVVRLIRAVPGVTAVRDEIIVDSPPRSPAVPAPATDQWPLEGWWPGRRPRPDRHRVAAAAA
ncbi:CBS domain-containing protein [Actinoplanes sp. KI2]|uniref:CBS domain-containing protein n=1 Tax=Actinoplanes sp. KI2 TaxID=2983315 RepID=UPI0021D5933B|nr:CBS domain-containing protein [Actinoplanes sp. KI2]MCU7730976.1 CBS domain-containing protein [Actinoplanes sp. KI2]